MKKTEGRHLGEKLLASQLPQKFLNKVHHERTAFTISTWSIQDTFELYLDTDTISSCKYVL